MSKTKTIAKLNDGSWKAPGLLCRMVLNEGIRWLQPDDRSRIVELVESYDNFTTDTDPHGEHDFGSFDYPSRKSAPQLRHGS